MRNPCTDAENRQTRRGSARLPKNVVVIRQILALSQEVAGRIERHQPEREEEEREGHDRGGLPPLSQARDGKRQRPGRSEIHDAAHQRSGSFEMAWANAAKRAPRSS